jgi:hypothetical protein
MSTWYYTFQLSRINTIEFRSRHGDVDVIQFGVLLDGNDQAHGSAVVPMFRNAIGGKEITSQSSQNGYAMTQNYVRMTDSWTIGPIEVTEGDTIAIVVSGTNTADSQLPTADQQKVDELTIKFLNAYYSWLLGQFISAFGLKTIAEFAVTGSAEVVSFLTDPVGWALGFEPSGPCNGPVFAGDIWLNAVQLEELEWTPDPVEYWTGPKEMATVTRSYDDAQWHNEERCGAIARTEVDVTIRRTPFVALRRQYGFEQRITSVRERYGDLESLKRAVGMRHIDG